MDIRLNGRSAVVTGGSKGLGLAIAEEYAKSGADVTILARDQGTLAEAKAKIQAGAPGRKIAAISCDVSKAADIRKTYDQIMSEFGKIDIYVNNAGQSTRGPSEELTDEMWQADLDLKLFAQIRFCRLVLPQMKQRRWGRIISVLNIGAKAPGADSAPTSVRWRLPRPCRRKGHPTTSWSTRCTSGSSCRTRSNAVSIASGRM